MEHDSTDLHQINEDHVVVEDVTVAHGDVGGLLPPLLEPQVKNNDAKRQDKDGKINRMVEGHTSTPFQSGLLSIEYSNN